MPQPLISFQCTGWSSLPGSPLMVCLQAAGLMSQRLKQDKVAQIRLVLWLLSTPLGTFLLVGLRALTWKPFPWLHSFPDLPLSRREGALLAWSQSRLLSFRSLFKVHRQLPLTSSTGIALRSCRHTPAAFLCVHMPFSEPEDDKTMGLLISCLSHCAGAKVGRLFPLCYSGKPSGFTAYRSLTYFLHASWVAPASSHTRASLLFLHPAPWRLQRPRLVCLVKLTSCSSCFKCPRAVQPGPQGFNPVLDALEYSPPSASGQGAMSPISGPLVSKSSGSDSSEHSDEFASPDGALFERDAGAPVDGTTLHGRPSRPAPLLRRAVVDAASSRFSEELALRGFVCRQLGEATLAELEEDVGPVPEARNATGEEVCSLPACILSLLWHYSELWGMSSVMIGLVCLPWYGC